ncbi:MAG TPA: tRNA lysidine(34) synthetase TilS [Clostridiales bacterium]|nr:tRNA lysidine(34) synthetase TilS [Clostridiales bacterium]
MKTITDFINKHAMLPRGTHVLCAVSGGADSMCLLHFLSSNAESLGITVAAAHFNHRLRGAEADRDQAFVEAWCKEHGILCETGSADVVAYAGQSGMSTEEAARNLRYEFLENCADKLGCTAIATAHNSDDNAETVLLNLTRGAGAKGLCGIPPVRGRLIRPLLATSRAQIEAYLAENGVPHITDSTNDTDDYTRNVIRHRVMPVLCGINPAFSASAMRTAELLREDEEFLDKLAADFLREHFENGSLPIAELTALPKPVAARALRKICGRSLTAGHIKALFDIMQSESLAHADIHGMRVTADHGRLYFGQKPAVLPDTPLHIGEKTVIGDGSFTVECKLMPKNSKVFNSLNTFFFNFDAVCGTIFFTSRKDGDKIRLNGRKCTKSLKDLFSEAKMTQLQRSETPVLRDEKGIIAVYGFGACERCSAKTGDAVLRVTINKTDRTGDNL